MLARVAHLLASLWAGLVLALGGVAAPVLFASLDRLSAGRIAGQFFRIEAQLALGAAVALFLIHRRIAAARADAGVGRRVSPEMVLVLGALFCTVFGYFGLQPMMEAARAGQGRWSFGALHGLSSALFALKGVLLLVLTWRGAAESACRT